jgi:hypothetical protein
MDGVWDRGPAAGCLDRGASLIVGLLYTNFCIATSPFPPARVVEKRLIFSLRLPSQKD